jgi:dipeptidyl aminopeptidase/acylaminoacyl peptidase
MTVLEPNVRRRVGRSLVFGFIALSLAAPQLPAQTALPLDLAVSRKTIRAFDHPIVSRDGAVLAYEVYTPPARSPESEVNEGVRFLPGGTPSEMTGLRIFVVATSGGTPRAVCPDKGNCWRPSLSPDGKRIAFFSDAGGSPQLWISDVAGGSPRRVAETPIKAKHWAGDEAEWSADGRELFVPIRPAGQPSPGAALPHAAPPAPGAPLDKAAVTVYSTVHAPAGAPETTPDYLMEHFIRENVATLAAIDIASGAVRTVVDWRAQPRPSCLRLSPDGKWVSYLSNFRTKGQADSVVYYDLAVVPAAGGKPVTIAADVQCPDTSDYFESTYRWVPGSTRLVFLKDKRLWLADAASPGAAPRQLGASVGNLLETPILLTPDGKSVLVAQAPEGEMTYYSVPAKAFAIVPIDGSAAKTIAASGTVVESGRDTLWAPGPDSFAAVVNDEQTGERSVVRYDGGTGAKSVLWKGRGRFRPIGGASGNGVVVVYESLDAPPDFYRFDGKFAAKQRLTHVEPRLEGVAVGPMEIFASTVPGFDGRVLPVETAVFFPPGRKAGERLPGLVYFYSGSRMADTAQDYGGGAPNSIPVQVFTTRGYAVLLVDVPLGPEGKGGNPIQEMGEAILAQVYLAANRGDVDISRMAIMGQSYGGYSTAAMITQTNLFRAAIALDGSYDLAGGFAHMGANGSNEFMWSETGQGRMGTHPWADLRRYLANSPYYQADKIHTPFLMVHGKRDETCPIEDAEKMYNALKRLERTVELREYDGEGHVPGEWSTVNAVDAMQNMVDWLAKYDVAAAPAK